ncbi:DUF4241 domain-containing protein [Kitasatospora saccharophila]|uniref:DUF4241 domain-containing protein n=1 Tax=Kitasatospora saccharophila TaxID=407973 RepID=A0ABN2X050_9ACTN
MTETRLEAHYCDGWDPATRSSVRPLPRAEAERRDAAGEPYAVVFRAPGREQPVAVLHLARAGQYAELHRLDPQGRRTFEIDLRALEPGRLFLRHLTEWRYERPEQPDRATDAWRKVLLLLPDGRGRQTVNDRGDGGGSYQTAADLPVESRWLPDPRFGHWAELLAVGRLGGTGPLPEITEPPLDPAPPQPAGPAEPFGWRPPRPATPPWPEELFTPGATFAHRFRAGTVTVEPPRTITEIALPSGRLAVHDPLHLGRDEPIVIEVPPGSYPVQESRSSFGRPGGNANGANPIGADAIGESYALRVLVSGKPPASWTPAVPPGGDPRLLGDGECFGFGTDSATGSFADADARPSLSARYKQYLTSRVKDGVETFDYSYAKVTDAGTGAGLLGFPLGGDGTVPVWIGRDTDGAVAAVVVPDPFEVYVLEPAVG